MTCPEFIYEEDSDASEGDSEDDDDDDENEDENANARATAFAGEALDYTRAKLVFIEREFLSNVDDERTMRDVETFLASCKDVKLTRDEFIEACKERSSSGRCGWRACRERVDVRGPGKKRYDVDAKARVVRDVSFVSAFCSRAHMLEAEDMSKRLDRATTTSARLAATTTAPQAREDDIIKAEVVERVVSAKSQEVRIRVGAPPRMAKAVSKDRAMEQARAVEGFVPRANKSAGSATSASKKVTWNEEDIAASTTKSSGDGTDDAGVFYFETYGEGQKPKDFVPSIGGRFAEGQLRTEPRDQPPIIIPDDIKDMEADLIMGSELKGLEGKTPEELALMAEDLARELLATRLTGNPLQGFDDGDEYSDEEQDSDITDIDDNDDDDEDSTSDKFSARPKSVASPHISQFGLTWMAVDNLVTNSTFAFTRGDSTYADNLPGRTKYSVSVSEAWNSSLAKYLPSLLRKLSLGDEIRRFEQKLTTLLRTFTFNRPVPAFSNERWEFITMLFAECVMDDEAMRTSVRASDLAFRVRASAGATDEEVELLRQRLRGEI